MIAYTIEAAIESNLFDEIFVSTDSEKYADIARSYGGSVPFLRCNDLATDSTSSWDVVENAIMQYKELGREFDTVALLQPTSPLRTAEDICSGFDLLEKKEANAIVSVCETDHSPLWTNTLPLNSSLEHFIKHDIISTPRQKLPTYFRINGALYIANIDYLLGADSIYSKECYAFIMDKEHSIDIDTEIDLELARVMLKSRNKSR